MKIISNGELYVKRSDIEFLSHYDSTFPLDLALEHLMDIQENKYIRITNQNQIDYLLLGLVDLWTEKFKLLDLFIDLVEIQQKHSNFSESEEYMMFHVNAENIVTISPEISFASNGLLKVDEEFKSIADMVFTFNDRLWKESGISEKDVSPITSFKHLSNRLGSMIDGGNNPFDKKQQQKKQKLSFFVKSCLYHLDLFIN